jgi:alpha-1,6-mannosyltransferase
VTPAHRSRLVRPLADQKYLLLSVAVVAFAAVAMARHRWLEGADIWEHAAVVRAFADSPLDPAHPELGGDAAHTFFSPYLFLLGVLGRLTGLSPFAVLAWAGVANVVLFLVALWLFVRLFTPDRDAPLYALVFTLVLWGPDMWDFSGFLHLKVFWQVLPYPATFAKGLSLLGVVSGARFLETRRPVHLVATLGVSVVVLLSHPIDAVFLYVLLGAWALALPDTHRVVPALLTVAGLGVLAFLLALGWPFFSFGRLLFGEAAYRSLIAGDERPLYLGVALRIAPTLLAAPIMAIRLWRRPRDPLGVAFFVLLVAYLVGGVTRHYFVGRLLVFVTTLVHVALAIEVAAAHPLARTGRRRAAALGFVAAVGVATILGAFELRRGLAPAVPDPLAGRVLGPGIDRGTDIRYWDSLLTAVGPDDVVLSPLETGWQVPAFTGRVVASFHPLAFVADHEARRGAVSSFFDPATAPDTRRQIMDRYCVSFLLFPSTIPATPDLGRLGTVRHSDARFSLVELDGATGCAS